MGRLGRAKSLRFDIGYFSEEQRKGQSGWNVVSKDCDHTGRVEVAEERRNQIM